MHSFLVWFLPTFCVFLNQACFAFRQSIRKCRYACIEPLSSFQKSRQAQVKKSPSLSISLSPFLSPFLSLAETKISFCWNKRRRQKEKKMKIGNCVESNFNSYRFCRKTVSSVLFLFSNCFMSTKQSQE